MEINEIVSAIESLTLIQASELVKALEEKFGVSAAAMLRRARSIIFADMSMSVTSQPSCARYTPYFPTPHPMSSTRQPEAIMPRSCQKRSCLTLYSFMPRAKTFW